ncbi:MAG: hypothetical protein EOO36_15245 [Cytophagaceae bacterium]|nr:MAG: hypothetical protein EOO36_15245 [Cytophagaceae bacterium]
MKLPYYYKLAFETLYSASELKARLVQHTLTDNRQGSKDNVLLANARRAAAHARPVALYCTEFTADGFALFRTVPDWDYQPVSRAVCVGRVLPCGTGCRVELTCKAVLFIRVFMFIWGFGAAFGILAILFSSLREGKYRDALITPFATSPFPFGFWLFHKVLFKNDVDKAVLFLRSLCIASSRW